MNKKTLIYILLVVFIGAALALVSFLILKGDGVGLNDSQDTSETIRLSDGAGLYLSYSSASFDEHEDKRRWLFFHASWCPQCVNLEEDIMANLSDIPDNVVIFKVDFDNSDDLRNRYGVSIQTTIVSVDGDGDKIKSHVASLDQSLAALIQNLD